MPGGYKMGGITVSAPGLGYGARLGHEGEHGDEAINGSGQVVRALVKGVNA
jgi:hypothetical protein